jgi:hypothetical protein
VCQFLSFFTRVCEEVGWASCVRIGVFVKKLDNWCSVSVSPIVDVMW